MIDSSEDLKVILRITENLWKELSFKTELVTNILKKKDKYRDEFWDAK